MNKFAVIEEVISLINTMKIGFIGALGVFERSISDSVNKYVSKDPRIIHFITYLYDGALQEVSFFCGDDRFSLAGLESVFGKARIGYNFRENYTQFSFDVNLGCVESIFFIKDNKFEIVSNGYEERTPRGNGAHHSDLNFNGFCLKLKNL